MSIDRLAAPYEMEVGGAAATDPETSLNTSPQNDDYQREPPTLMTIPLELRNMIFKKVFQGVRVIHAINENGLKRHRTIESNIGSILQVSKQCNQEAKPYLQAEVLIVIPPNQQNILFSRLDADHDRNYHATVPVESLQWTVGLPSFRGLHLLTSVVTTHFPDLQSLTLRSAATLSFTELHEMVKSDGFRAKHMTSPGSMPTRVAVVKHLMDDVQAREQLFAGLTMTELVQRWIAKAIPLQVRLQSDLHRNLKVSVKFGLDAGPMLAGWTYHDSLGDGVLDLEKNVFHWEPQLTWIEKGPGIDIPQALGAEDLRNALGWPGLDSQLRQR